VRRFFASAMVALGLVGFFVAVAGVLGPRLNHWMDRPIQPSTTAEYVGDWECETRNLDLHISGSGQQLTVNNLDETPVTFERQNDSQPFREKDGRREMRCKYKHLSVTLADGKEYGFRLRE